MPEKLRKAIDEERAKLDEMDKLKEEGKDDKSVSEEDLHDFSMFLEESSEEEGAPALGDRIYMEV